MELRGSSKKAEDQMRVSPSAFCAQSTGRQNNRKVQAMSSGGAIPAASLLQHMAASA